MKTRNLAPIIHPSISFRVGRWQGLENTVNQTPLTQ
jgi:hypothetical protein